MKVRNMTSNNGNTIANQFILESDKGKTFQSYNSIIAFVPNNGKTQLDQKYWNYSKTTSKYRNQFLYETTKETEAKIKSGEYELTDLNK